MVVYKVYNPTKWRNTVVFNVHNAGEAIKAIADRVPGNQLPQLKERVDEIFPPSPGEAPLRLNEIDQIIEEANKDEALAPEIRALANEFGLISASSLRKIVEKRIQEERERLGLTD